MKKFFLISVMLGLIGLMCACVYNTPEQSTKNKEEIKDTTSSNNEDYENSTDSKWLDITVKVGDTTFSAILEDNATSKLLVEKLPLKLDMKDLNNNEKYYFFSSPFPTNSQSMDKIEVGDLMLYGNNCLVLFYESFNSSYRYTRIGRIKNNQDLKFVLGNNNVEVEFLKK